MNPQEHHDAIGHASADDEYLVTPAGAGYEHTDASVWIIAKFGLWLAIAAVVIHIGMFFVFGLFVEQREETDPTFPLAIGQERRLPVEPRLQTIPANDIYQFRLQEQQVLDNYRWVDRGAGVVQIPIAEAMRLTVERGLPARAQPAADDPAAAPGVTAADTPGQTPMDAPARTSIDTPGLMPADSSSGRTMERRRQ